MPGLPKGVLNLVLGDGPGAGAPLLAHPDVNVISFTGSTETGRLVNQACAPTFKKVHLEMGGKNVILVMDDANLDLAVDGALWGGFGTTRPALHGRQPRGRAREGLRDVRRGVRRPGQDAARGRRPGRERRRWGPASARRSCSG